MLSEIHQSAQIVVVLVRLSWRKVAPGKVRRKQPGKLRDVLGEQTRLYTDGSSRLFIIASHVPMITVGDLPLPIRPEKPRTRATHRVIKPAKEQEAS
jgi:hypothetical protein